MTPPEISAFAITPFTTPLATTRVGIDWTTGNIWQYQGTRGMVNVGNIPAPPVCTVAPVISGPLAHGGAALNLSAGTWNPTGTQTIQWYSAGVAIPGQTAGTYYTTVSDVGNMITCIVTQSNTGGVTSATSNALGPIT